MVGVKCFSMFCVLIFADSKSGKILMPNDVMDFGFFSYGFTFFLVGMKLNMQDLMY